MVYGQTTEVFARYPEPARANLSFSLLYKPSNSLRTLDLTCEGSYDFELWFQGIQVPICFPSKHRCMQRHACGFCPAWVMQSFRNALDQAPGRMLWQAQVC